MAHFLKIGEKVLGPFAEKKMQRLLESANLQGCYVGPTANGPWTSVSVLAVDTTEDSLSLNEIFAASTAAMTPPAKPPRVIQVSGIKSVPTNRDDTTSRNSIFGDPIAVVITLIGSLLIIFGAIIYCLEAGIGMLACFGTLGMLTLAFGLRHQLGLAIEWMRDRLAEWKQDRDFGRYSAMRDGSVRASTNRSSTLHGLRQFSIDAIGITLVGALIAVVLGGIYFLVSPWAAIAIVILALTYVMCFCYFWIMQAFEDNFLVFFLLLAVASFACFPYVYTIATSSMTVPILASIAHIFAVGSSIKFCINGLSAHFCTTYLLLWQIAIGFMMFIGCGLEAFGRLVWLKFFWERL